MKSRLWAVLQNRKLEQKKVAAELGLHHVRLNQLCNGREPTRLEAKKICEHFSMDESDLFSPVLFL